MGGTGIFDDADGYGIESGAAAIVGELPGGLPVIGDFFWTMDGVAELDDFDDYGDDDSSDDD